MYRRLLPALAALQIWLPTIAAAILLGLIFFKAVSEIDPTWDSLAYHIPFEALRTGILTPQQYQFLKRPDFGDLGHTLDGYPILGDVIRGTLWKVTGRVESANLLSLLSLISLTSYVRWAYKVNWGLVVLALLAIPQVQTTAASNYIDLSANCFYTIMLLSICDLHANPERFERWPPWIVLFLSAFLAAHMKLQISIFVVLTLPSLVWPTWRLLQKHKLQREMLARYSVVGFVALTLIGANFLKNLFVYGNPFWPVDMNVGVLKFAGPFKTANWWDIPIPLRDAPQPLRWVLSLLEFRSLGLRFVPWTNGMGDVPAASWSSRMGGYYGGLVVASVCFLFVGFVQKRDRVSAVFMTCFLILTAVLSVFPNSQELRYEMFWMLFLVIACLILLSRLAVDAYFKSYRIVCVASLVFVASVTGGTYFTFYQPGGLSLKRLLAQNPQISKELDETVRAGDTICLTDWGPYLVLYAPIFHPEITKDRPYFLQEGTLQDGVSTCAGKKTISKTR